MLCMKYVFLVEFLHCTDLPRSCQWDVNGPSSGIDAGIDYCNGADEIANFLGPGAYTAYRTLGSPTGAFCTPGTNQS